MSDDDKKHRDCSGYFEIGFGSAVRFDELPVICRPGTGIDLMPDAMVVGRCKDCKYWADIGEHNSDPTICVCEKASVGTAKYDFGCVMWELREDA